MTVIDRAVFARLFGQAYPRPPNGPGGATTVVMALPEGRPCPACGEPHACAHRFGQRTLPARPRLGVRR